MGRVVSVGLYLFAIAGVVLLILAFDAHKEFTEWERAASTRSTQSMFDADDRLFTMLAAVTVARVLFAGLFVAWLWNLHKRVSELPGIEPRWARGWTIGSWVIPVALLWLPYKVVDDLHGRLGKPAAPVALWWWTFVAMTLGLQSLSWFWDSEAWGGFYIAALFSSLLLITAAAAGAKMVERLTDAAVDASTEPGAAAAETAFLRDVHAAVPSSRTAARSTLLGMGYELLAADHDGQLAALVAEIADDDALARDELEIIAGLARRHLQATAPAA